MRAAPWYDGNNALSEWQNAKVCSDFLFAVEKDSGKTLWKYEGLIINTAIAIGDGSIYFVENRNKLIADSSDFFYGDLMFLSYGRTRIL